MTTAVISRAPRTPGVSRAGFVACALGTWIAGSFGVAAAHAAGDAQTPHRCGGHGTAMPDTLPAPKTLEALGARIGRVDVVVEDIFDPSNPAEGAAPYRIANTLHIETREDAVRSQLLFSESEPYSQQKIEETERLLRGRRYLFDAHVIPSCYHQNEHTVDVDVRVRDVWSLNPGFSFSRKGGENGTGLKVEDQDFMGRGELLSLGWKSDVDRNSLRLVYEDPQLLGTWWRGRVSLADNSDGGTSELSVGRPFYSLDTRWSAGTDLQFGDRRMSRYREGHVLDEFDENVNRFAISGGRSRGLQNGWTRRWLAGIRYDASDFTASPDSELVAALPEDRKLVYPWVGLEWIEDEFDTAHNRDQIGRTEDVHYGTSLRADLGLASAALGSDRNAALFALNGSTGFRFGESDSLLLGSDLTGRLEPNGLRDAALQGEARYYHRQRDSALFFATARANAVVDPDLDHQLLLGGDNGLRGYPLRYQSGTASVLFTAEERFFTKWFPFRLYQIGAAVFADAGRTWGDDVAGQSPLGWLADAGVGLRIGNSRSGLGNVLHVDLAVPLNRQPGIDSVQLLIETRGSF
jgi:outer membrane translocation and assembly module TamA